MNDLKIKWSRKQKDFFYGLTSKYRLLPSGRRTGKTVGAAQYLILECLRSEQRCLWVDTVYTNIDRYFERIFKPILDQIPRDHWEWRQQKKELKIGESLIDFRSADRPQNIEGFGYSRIVLNEAGIILAKERGRYLWFNAILPMTMDYQDCIVEFVGTSKGKTESGGVNALYYDMWLRCQDPEDENWQGITMSTEDNPFLNAEAIQEVKKELPSGSIRDQEFFGKFTDLGTGIIKGEWFRYREKPLSGYTRVRSWDMAFSIKDSADWSAGALCAKYPHNELCIEDMSRVKMIYPEFKKHVIETAWSDGRKVPIILEQAGQQVGFVDDFRRTPELQGFTILASKPHKDKFSRAMPWVAAAEGGLVSMVRGAWNGLFTSEAEAFTANDSHAHDDQLDAVSSAYEKVMKMPVQAVDNPLML